MKDLIKSVILNEEDFNFSEDASLLMEKLITLGGKTYPKFNNIVILAGGAGSGKGFVTDKLLGIEGSIFDVDYIKTLALKSPKIKEKVKKEFGLDIGEMDLKNPDDVSKLHEIMNSLGINDKRIKALYTSISQAKNKPNIIFDVTLKDLYKLASISTAVKGLGYLEENIHIVWVVNSIEIAKKQNELRSRKVPVEILVNTHRGVSQTMNDILSLGQDLKRYMDGDIVLAFNQIGVDTEIEKSGLGGKFIKHANYVHVKHKGKQVTSPKDLSKEVLQKISSYVPRAKDWEV